MTLLVNGAALELASVNHNNDRRAVYRTTRANPAYNGPVVIAEGDSWFCYPSVPFVAPDGPVDIVSHLLREFAVLGVGIPGASAWSYRDQFLSPNGLKAQIEFEKPDILLLSGGGNDLLGNLGPHLKAGGAMPASWLAPAFGAKVEEVAEHLDVVARASIAAASGVGKDLAVILNAYDYALPTGNGHWLKDPMDALGMPDHLRADVIRLMVGRFRKRLGRIVDGLRADFGGPNERFAVARTIGVTPEGGWHNDIHPDTKHFGRMARRFRTAILAAKPLVG
jgi:hypothetical protein